MTGEVCRDDAEEASQARERNGATRRRSHETPGSCEGRRSQAVETRCWNLCRCPTEPCARRGSPPGKAPTRRQSHCPHRASAAVPGHSLRLPGPCQPPRVAWQAPVPAPPDGRPSCRGDPQRRACLRCQTPTNELKVHDPARIDGARCCPLVGFQPRPQNRRQTMPSGSVACFGERVPCSPRSWRFRSPACCLQSSQRRERP